MKPRRITHYNSKSIQIYTMTKKLLFVLFLLSHTFLSAQNCLELIAPHVETQVGEQICVSIKSYHFNHIENLQFSFAWDKEILDYVNLNTIALTAFDIEVTIPEEGGQLGFDCTLQNPNDAAVSLPDDATLFDICFNVIGEDGNTSPLTISNAPIPIVVTNDCPPDTPDCAISCISTVNGKVKVGITDDDVLKFQMGNVTLNNLPENTETEIVVPVTVENFKDIVSMQYTITWNPDNLTFVDVDCFLPNCTNNFGNGSIEQGILIFSWIETSLNATNLPDGTIIYNLHFTVSTNLNETSFISFFSTPASIEIVNAQEIVQPIVATSGQITPSNQTLSSLNFGEWNIGNSQCSTSTGQSSIEVEIIGGTAPYSYRWFKDNSLFSTEEDLFNLSGGTYFLTVTDALSDTLKAMVHLISPHFSSADISLEESIQPDYGCDVTGEGSINIEISQNTGVLNYQWSNGSTTQDINNLVAGDYEVSVTSGGGCVSTKQFTVPFIETLHSSIDLPACNTDELGAIYLFYPSTPLNNFQFEWSNGDNMDFADSLEVGFHNVTITYPNSGCTEIKNFEIYKDLFLRGNAVCNETSEIDSIFTIIWNEGTPPFAFQWNNGETLVSDVIRNDFAFESGFYEVTVTDDGDCKSFTDFTVDCNFVTISGSHITCENDIYRYDATSTFDANQYEWQVINGTIINLNDTVPNGQNTPTIFVEWPSNNDMNKFVKLIATNENGISDTTETEIFTEIPPVFEFTAIDYCEFEDSLTICHTNASNIVPVWTTTSGEFIAQGNCATIINDTTFFPQLEVIIPYGNSCEFISPVAFNLPGTISIASSDTIICQGEAVELDIIPLGSVLESVAWLPDSSLSCGDCLETIASPEVSTTYLAEIKDETGCYFYGPIEIEVNDCVWPGDTDTSKTANHFDLLNIGLGFGSTGFVRPNASLNWVAQIAPDWIQQTPSSDVNYKHIDSDGDGQVTALDTLAIIQNWGLMHNFVSQIEEHFRPSEEQMMIPMYVQPDTIIENETYALPIILGELDVPAQEVYGLAFSLSYEPETIVPGSAKVDFANSWLGTLNQDMISIQKDFHAQGRIDVAITRINGQNINGNGTIGHFFITIEDDILLLAEMIERNAADTRTIFQVENVRLISFEEERIPVLTPTTEAEIISSSNSTIWEQQLQVFPNPTKDMLIISSQDIQLERIELFDIRGQRLLLKNGQHQDIKLDLSNVSAGCFWLKIQTKEGIAVRKIIVEK